MRGDVLAGGSSGAAVLAVILAGRSCQVTFRWSAAFTAPAARLAAMRLAAMRLAAMLPRRAAAREPRRAAAREQSRTSRAAGPDADGG